MNEKLAKQLFDGSYDYRKSLSRNRKKAEELLTELASDGSSGGVIIYKPVRK